MHKVNQANNMNNNVLSHTNYLNRLLCGSYFKLETSNSPFILNVMNGRYKQRDTEESVYVHLVFLSRIQRKLKLKLKLKRKPDILVLAYLRLAKR